MVSVCLFASSQNLVYRSFNEPNSDVSFLTSSLLTEATICVEVGSLFSTVSNLLSKLTKTLLSTAFPEGELSFLSSFSCSVSITHCSTLPKRNVIRPIASEMLSFVNGSPFWPCCCCCWIC